MADSSMKDIKLRIRSVESTRQITKAMQLVATSKIRRAKERMENSRPYTKVTTDALHALAAHCTEGNAPFITKRPVRKRCYIVIAGDRGLAGGYNANVFRALEAQVGELPYCVLPVGHKAVEKFQHLRSESLDNTFFPVAGMPVSHCYKMANILIDAYNAEQFDELWIVGTHFKSMLTQEVEIRQLLPLTYSPEDVSSACVTVFEPNAETMLRHAMPDVLAGWIYSALCDASASENAARRNAMDSATKNADSMISSLTLKYNQARQGSITQEITEIVAGAEN